MMIMIIICFLYAAAALDATGNAVSQCTTIGPIAESRHTVLSVPRIQDCVQKCVLLFVNN